MVPPFNKKPKITAMPSGRIAETQLFDLYHIFNKYCHFTETYLGVNNVNLIEKKKHSDTLEPKLFFIHSQKSQYTR